MRTLLIAAAWFGLGFGLTEVLANSLEAPPQKMASPADRTVDAR